MRETAQTITTWGLETCPNMTEADLWAKLDEEIKELKAAMSNRAVAEEGADVRIILTRLIAHIGYDLDAETDRKMSIVRSRVYDADGKRVDL